jgi:iron complex outermembrane receptor protein
LTVGSKLEENDYSGLEYQPSARISWDVAERHVVWAAVSRAVRTPSVIDFDGRLTPVVVPGIVPIAFSILGDHDFRSEVLLAYEAGYRLRPVDPLSLDLALFYNDYRHLRSGEVGVPFVETVPPPIHVVIPINLANALRGRTTGAELAANVQAAKWWLVQGSVSVLDMSLSEEDVNGQNPRSQFWIRSAMDLPGGVTLDVNARRVGELRSYDVRAYDELDVSLAWRDPARPFELALVGQNLLRGSHPEFRSATERSEIQRGVYASLTWRKR